MKRRSRKIYRKLKRKTTENTPPLTIPSHNTPSQPTPSHNTPSHTTTSHNTPSHITTSHNTPSHTKTSHNTPSHTIPSHNTPSHNTLSHTTISHNTPSHTPPSHNTPTHTTNRKHPICTLLHRYKNSIEDSIDGEDSDTLSHVSAIQENIFPPARQQSHSKKSKPKCSKLNSKCKWNRFHQEETSHQQCPC